MKKTVWVLLLLFVVAVPAMGKMYKWIDENGQVVYSQRPPLEQEAKEIKPPPPPPTGSSEARKKLDAKLQNSKQKWADKKENKKKKKEGGKQSKQRMENCQNAQKNYDNMKRKSQKYYTDETGKRHHLNAVTREEQLNKAQQQIDKYCP